MSFFTPEEKLILRSLDARDRIKSKRDVLDKLSKKLEIQRGNQIKALEKSEIGKYIGGNLGAINHGRSRYIDRIRVMRFFRKILLSANLMAIPSLKGISLTLSEKRLLTRIRLKKQEYLHMVLNEHARHHANSLKSKDIRSIDKNYIRKIPKMLTLDKIGVNKINNQYKDISLEIYALKHQAMSHTLRLVMSRGNISSLSHIKN